MIRGRHESVARGLVDESAERVLEVQRAEQRRRRRWVTAVALGFGGVVVLAAVLAVLVINSDEPTWAAVVVAAVTAFDLLSEIFFLGLEVRQRQRR